jgi:RNA polymerase sigma factor (sigma-70 family)
MVDVGTLPVECGEAEAVGADVADDDLVVRARVDRAAFAILYARYADRIYWYCYLRLGDRELAEDATSLTFAKALAALPTCREDRFRAWLFRLARNVVVDAVRERRQHAPLEDAAWVPDLSPSPEDIALRQEGNDRARTLLAQLSEGQRWIVELRLAGLTGAEIARVLGRPHVWVRVTQLRAYQRLRTILEKEGVDDCA